MLAITKCGTIKPDRSAFRSTVRRLPSVASGQYYDGDGAVEAGYTLAVPCFWSEEWGPPQGPVTDPVLCQNSALLK